MYIYAHTYTHTPINTYFIHTCSGVSRISFREGGGGSKYFWKSESICMARMVKLCHEKMLILKCILPPPKKIKSCTQYQITGISPHQQVHISTAI